MTINLTQKQKKILIPTIAILIAIYFAPSVILGIHQFMFNMRHAAEAQVQPIAPNVEPKPAEPVDPDAPPFPVSTLAGFWSGEAFQKTGVCMVHLELRESPDARNHLQGFPSISCVNAAAAKFGGPPGAMTGLNPTTAIMDGKWDKANLDFTFAITKSIAPDNCPVTKFVLTPIGNTGMTAEWAQGECQSGTMVMQRTNR